MKIVAGLGNPGKKYSRTRHNIGFRVIDRLGDRWKATSPKVQFKGEVQTATFQGDAVMLLQPQTFMNLSGESVQAALQFHKVKPAELIVIHDEMDLDPMALRIKSGGGPGGHNGLKSINEAIGPDYLRVRMGVGHPSKLGLFHDPADYVLGDFTGDEELALPEWIDRACLAIEKILTDGPLKAMTEFNREKKES